MTRNTQGTQATNTYAWLLEMVKRNAFIIQLDKWKQLVWMLWYIDSLLKSRQNCLQVGSMAISILMSRFIYAKKYCFNQEQGGQHGSKWQNPVGLVSSGAGTGGGGHAIACPPQWWCLPGLGIHGLRPKRHYPIKFCPEFTVTKPGAVINLTS